MMRVSMTEKRLPAAPPAAGRTRAALISLLTSYVGAGIAIVKGVVLVPLYLRTLGVDVYGAFLASANVVGLLGIVDFGVSAVLYQRLAAAWGARDLSGFKRLTGAAILVVPALVVTMVAASVFIAPYVPGLIKAPQRAHAALTLTFVLTAIGAGGTLATLNLAAVASAWQRAEIAAAARLGAQFVEIAVLVAGLLGGLGVVALGLASLVGGWTGLVISGVWTAVAWHAMGLPRPRPNRGAALDLARTVVPMMLSRIALQVGSNVEVALISRLVNPTMAAIYGITDRIFRVAMSFVSPIAGSVSSGLSHFVGERGICAARKPAREILALLSLVVAATLPTLVAMNRDFTTLWVGPKNYGGTALTILLCAAAILSTRQFLLFVVLTASGAITTAAWIGVFEVLLRVPLVYIALRFVGAAGMPAASSVVSVLCLVVYARFVNRKFEIRGWERGRFQLAGMLSVSVCFSIGMGGLFALPVATTWTSLLLKGALVGGGHLGLALLLNPAGRTVALGRLVSRWKR
jgi:O-antigen/teichoic acid export membrane protein